MPTTEWNYGRVEAGAWSGLQRFVMSIYFEPTTAEAPQRMLKRASATRTTCDVNYENIS